MSQLKVIVPRLNKRKFPVEDTIDKSNVVGEVVKDFQFEGKAGTVNKLGTWYVDRDGFFYWGGGISESEQSFATSFSPGITFPWWIKNSFYSIPELWHKEGGPKITIAILDTGINEHIDFDFTKITGFNYLNNSTDFKTDDFGHGTHLAGILVAKGVKSFGVMPSANLFVAKVCDSMGVPIFSAVKQALEDILHAKNGAAGIDVINMSFDLADGNDPELLELKKDIEKLIKQISADRKCICVAACGDDGLDTDKPFECFPANMQECISVGGFTERLERDPVSNKSVNLDIMGPSANIISLNGKSNTIIMSGTSQSAAFVSGVCALGIEKLRSQSRFSDSLIKSVLFKTARLLPGQPPVEFGHGFIDPNLFISSL